jgi:membrane protease YdiL (CAAX protease family)
MRILGSVSPTFLKNLPSWPFLVPFVISTSVIALSREGRSALSWVRLGNIRATDVILVALTSFASAVALLVWAFWTDHLGIGVQMIQQFKEFPRWQVIGVGIPVFALINAFSEEVVYRGVLQEALIATIRKTGLAVLLQADAFAMEHFAGGFPNGYAGYAMVLVYGGMLGYLRVRTRGMLAPFLAHVVADLVIAYFLFFKLL